MIVGVSGYIGPRKTGIGRVLENVLISLARSHPENTYFVFVNFDQDELLAGDIPANLLIKRYPVSKRKPLRNILWHQYGFHKLLLKFNCELSLIPNFSLVVWKAVPTAVVIHDLIEFHVKGKFSKLRMFYRHIAVPMMASKADKIITVSQYSKSDIVALFKVPPDKVVVAPNAYDAHSFRKRERHDIEAVISAYHLSYGGYILSVGTIDHPGKNLLSLVTAYVHLRNSNAIDEKLVVVGANGHNARVVYDYVQQSGHEGDILFLGYVEDHHLPFLYAGARVFCSLSLYEGFGLPLIEAMACGCPVIASHESCYPEVVGDAAVLVPPLDVPYICDALNSVITSDEKRTELSKKGAKRASLFNWQASADIYHRVFESLRAHA